MTGTVEAVYRLGIIVDLNLDRIGLIDSLYIDRDHVYTAGEQVIAFLTHFDVAKNEYILRPPDQVPIAERIDFAKL